MTGSRDGRLPHQQHWIAQHELGQDLIEREKASPQLVSFCLKLVKTGILVSGFIEEPERVLVPDDLDEGVGELAALNQLNSLSMTVSGGYVYDWNIFGHVFMSALGNIGLAFSVLELASVSAPRERTPAYGLSVAAQLGLSYVGESFHVGVTSNAAVDNVSASGMDIYTQRFSSMLFMGMRL